MLTYKKYRETKIIREPSMIDHRLLSIDWNRFGTTSVIRQYPEVTLEVVAIPNKNQRLM